MREQSMKQKRNYKEFFSKYGIFLALVLIYIVVSILTHGNFINLTNQMNVFRQVSINGILAIGMTFVCLTGGIDLSVGAIVAFTGFIAANTYKSGYGIFLAFVFAILVGIGFGMLNGYFIAIHDLAPFIVTLGVQTIARGLTYIYSDGMPVSQFDQKFMEIGKGSFLHVPIPVWILLIVFLLASFVLYKLKIGRYLFAVGGNETAATYSGVNVKRVKFFAYIASGALSALAAVVLTSRVSAALPQAGMAYESDAIASVVIGGTSLSGGKGHLWGTIVGVLIIGVISNGLDLLSVSSYTQQVIKGVIIIGAVLLDRVSNRAN